MLGVYNYTVLMTYLGMLIGYMGITFALHGDIQIALFCLMGSGFCDMFDGKIASTKKDRTVQEKRFGIQIDSLSDLICFGVLPAVIVYMACEQSSLAFYVSGAYVLCALIRLAWFNVDEEERQNTTDSARSYYLGLPVTTAALFLPTILGASLHYRWNNRILAPIVLTCMGCAFLTPFKLKKPELAGKIGVLFMGALELVILLAGVDL
ncbi:MAG: CDP-alcohol phosphatidyltransferase family protein [Eubacteriales bacterium]|nr:CDP-alcohol phosphatidyltransferase family protein [Eubacteriales bacterium]